MLFKMPEKGEKQILTKAGFRKVKIMIRETIPAFL
jgi:hypothetical protein